MVIFRNNKRKSFGVHNPSCVGGLSSAGGGLTVYDIVRGAYAYNDKVKKYIIHVTASFDVKCIPGVDEKYELPMIHTFEEFQRRATEDIFRVNKLAELHGKVHYCNDNHGNCPYSDGEREKVLSCTLKGKVEI